MRGSIRTFSIAAFVVCALFTAAQAAPLGLLLDYPVLVTYDVQVNYAAGGPGEDGYLTVNGTFAPYANVLQNFSADGTPPGDTYYGSFRLEAYIDKATRMSVSGSLQARSDIDWDGMLDTTGPFGTGDPVYRAYSEELTAFGFTEQGDILDFWFLNGTGDLATGGAIGVIVPSLDGLAPGFVMDTSFASDFSGGGKADIPEPATLGLLALAGLGLIRRRSR